MAKPARRGTVRVKRKIVDGDTIGVTITPVKPVRTIKSKPKRKR